MLVVVATEALEGASAADELRRLGAAAVTERAVGQGRTLVYGGPFDDRRAVEVAAAVRDRGHPADVRPEGGGHLAAWRAHTRPVVVGGRLWVSFPWSEFDRDEAKLLVEIDPGRAFGTGAHPTTHLLLTELAARIHGGESVLDIGSGSGVLAIAAARLGASKVTAIDISPDARAATKANYIRNNLGKRVEVCDTPVAQLTTEYDVIVANIHAEALTELAPAIQDRLAPGGWLALSGVSPAQVSKVEAAYRELEVLARRQDADWCAVVARRNVGGA